jgi:hypothetical protein
MDYENRRLYILVPYKYFYKREEWGAGFGIDEPIELFIVEHFPIVLSVVFHAMLRDNAEFVFQKPKLEALKARSRS